MVMDTPLPPISSPFALLSSLGVSSSLAVEVLVGLVILFWVVYTLIAIYHWMHYSHAALIAIPAITVHLVISGILILFALSGLVAL
jgi:hypothetical protein